MKKMYAFIFLLSVFFAPKMNAQITVLNENFTSCNGALPAGWQQYSVTGSDSWKCTASGVTDKAVYMNGYSGGGNNDNQDWLISPAVNLNSYSAPHLYFWSRTKFNGSAIQVLVSNNYAGSGNPNAATWNTLPVTLPATNSDTWLASENINLSAYKNQPFYIAFKYTSTVNAAALWRVDDIHIYENALSLNKKFVNAGQCGVGSYSAATPFVFTMTGLTGNLEAIAPAPFQISKDNIIFSNQLTYNAAASGIPQTVYTRLNPTVADKVHRDSITFSYNGYPVMQKQYILGTSLPDDRTLRVVNWNMRWFGDPSMCNCDTSVARTNATAVLKDLNADVYCLQEVVNVNQLANVTATLGPNYQYIVSSYCSGVTNIGDPFYPTCQKLAYIYNTSKLQNLGTFGLLSSTYPADTTAYYCFGAGRFPFIMKAKILLANGASDTVIFANIHGKAYDAQEDYNRRQCGAEKMTDSLHALFPNNKVMVIGDYNDLLEGSTVAGNINSPYKYMLDNGFTGITLPSKYAGQSTYVWSTDYIIDNIACEPAMYSKYADSSFFIFTETLRYIPDFGNSTSDHFPGMSYYKFNFPNAVSDVEFHDNQLFFNIQNPSSNELQIVSTSQNLFKPVLTVYDVSGQLIFRNQMEQITTGTKVYIPSLTKGLYFVEIRVGNKKGTQKWIIE